MNGWMVTIVMIVSALYLCATLFDHLMEWYCGPRSKRNDASICKYCGVHESVHHSDNECCRDCPSLINYFDMSDLMKPIYTNGAYGDVHISPHWHEIVSDPNTIIASQTGLTAERSRRVEEAFEKAVTEQDVPVRPPVPRKWRNRLAEDDVPSNLKKIVEPGVTLKLGKKRKLNV